MVRGIGRLADRLLSLVVPKEVASACPCNDAYCNYTEQCSGRPELFMRYYTNCQCEIIKTSCDC